jgi:hypothetical protein
MAPGPVGYAGPALVAFAGTSMLALLVAIDGPTTIRLPLALLSALLTPGLPVVALLRLRPSAASFALAIAVSLAATAIVSETLLLAAQLSAGHGAVALLAVSAPFVAWAWQRDREHRWPDWRLGRPAVAPDQRRLLALTGSAAVCAVVSCLTLDPGSAGDLGLVTSLPVVWWLGFGLLSFAFVAHLREGVRPALAAVQIGLLVAFLYAVVTVAEPYARIPTSYTHVGIVDYLVRDGSITSFFDARLSWAGSLGSGALLTQLSGAESSAAFVRWAIPVVVGLWALAVFALARSFTRSSRIPWIATALFLICNWVGQDYWSSQAVGFFMTITAVAAVTTWMPRRVFRGRGRYLPFEQPDEVVGTSAQTVGLTGAVLLITTALACSHQLSPFILLGFLFVLWLADRRDIRLLPLAAAAIVVIWFSWFAEAYWIGHLQKVTNDVGDVGGVVSRGTFDRIQDAATGRQVVLGTRLALSGAVWLAAGIWSIVSLRRGRLALLPCALLAATPFASVALQSYGGELGLRIFLFSLPFASILLADAISRLRRLPLTNWRRVVLAGLLLVTVAAFLTARYGNERFEQAYREDIHLVQHFQRVAPAGSSIIGTNTSNPFRMLPYRSYRTYGAPLLEHPELVASRDVLRATGVSEGYIAVFRAAATEARLRRAARVQWDLELRDQLLELGAEQIFRDGRAALYHYELAGVPPGPPEPEKISPDVGRRTRTLLKYPAFVLALGGLVILIAACLTHAAGRRWRAGVPDFAAVGAIVVIGVLTAVRLVILT